MFGFTGMYVINTISLLNLDHYLFKIQTEKYCINFFNLLKQTINTIPQDYFKTVLFLQFYLRECVSLTQEPSMWTCDACTKCGKDENLIIVDD